MKDILLAIDMGNSQIKIGLVRLDGEEIFEERVTTNRSKSSLEYADDIYAVMRFHHVDAESICGAILSSVVPPLTGVMETAVKKALGLKPIIVSHKLKMRVSLEKFHYPKGIGSDLIVGTEALTHDYPLPAILINMGTATAVSVVDSEGRFTGGSLLPGMKAAAESLWQNASALPEVSLDSPGRIISRDTSECMRSGIIYGMAGAIDAIVERTEDEIGPASLIATGGMARFAIGHSRHKITMDPTLLMRGLRYLYLENVSL